MHQDREVKEVADKLKKVKQQIADIEKAKIPIVYTKEFWKREDILEIWHQDELNRIEAAETLIKVISRFKTLKKNESTTVIVKSPWGTGKTFFVDKLQETLKKAGFFTVKFSAWEAELYDSPAQYFVESFMEVFASIEALNSEFAEYFQKIFLTLGKFSLFLSKVTKLEDFAPKSVTLKIPGMDVQSPAFPVKSLDALKDEINKIGKNWLDSIENADKVPSNLKEAKEFLEDHVEEVITAPLVEGKPFQEKIYIFIDELDRCRPDFAITILETLKHFFSVKGIVFVLSVDLKQLETSIRHIYGLGMDTEGYLMRFVNMFYNLPKPNNYDYANYLKTQISYTPDTLTSLNFSLENAIPIIFKTITQTCSFSFIFSTLADMFEASLRDQQRIISRLNLMLASDKIFLFPTIYLLFVQLKFPQYYIDKVNSWSIGELDLANLRNQFPSFRPTMRGLKDPINKMLTDSLELIPLANMNDFAEKIAEKKRNYRSYMTGDTVEHEKSRVNFAFISTIEKNRKSFSKQIDILNLYLVNFSYE